MPHPGMPSTGTEPTRASQRRLPGCAGTPFRTTRPPSRSIAVNTGSSGSSAFAPAITTMRAPAAIDSSTARASAPASASGYASPRESRRTSRASPQDGLEPRARPGRQAARGDCADGPALEPLHGHACPGPPAALLHVADHALRDDEGRDLGARDHLPRVDHLAVEQRVHRHALEPVHRGEQRHRDPQDPSLPRDDRPLAARGIPDRDARSRGRTGDPLPRRLLVEVAGLHLDEVDLVLCSGNEPRRGRRIEPLPFAGQQRASRITDVVGQDPADQAVGARLGRDERVRLHAAGVRRRGRRGRAAEAEPPACLATTRGRPVPP